LSSEETQPSAASSQLPTRSQPSYLPEVVIALVRAIGTDVSETEKHLLELFKGALYDVHLIKLSQLFRTLKRLKDRASLQETPEFERYRSYMNAGDLLRTATGRGDAAALLAVKRIVELRQIEEKKAVAPRGRAFILSSLMHPAEVKTLRQIYGAQLFVISVFSRREDRENRLMSKLAGSTGCEEAGVRPGAAWLVNRDMGVMETGQINAASETSQKMDVLEAVLAKKPKLLLNVGKTFERADLFVSSTDVQGLRENLQRFVEIIFDYPFHTPTPDEFGMTMAYAARLRSASLARQIGAAIVSCDSEVIALGTNEVPKFGGGAYWPGDKPDGRDFRLGVDKSDATRRQMISDFIARLCKDPTWVMRADTDPSTRELERKLMDHLKALNVEQAVDAALTSESGLVLDSRVMDVIEYVRAVHAEMAAITDAAKRGVSIDGATLYCTTFPCHECARHVVAAGIRRVYYIEPFPKSRVADLYPDSIHLGDHPDDDTKRVQFLPYVGISPLRYVELFTAGKRKKVDMGEDPKRRGDVREWTLASGKIRRTILSNDALKSGVRQHAIRYSEEHFANALDEALQVWEDEAREPLTL
jgi:deoxycytidylate deaminase